MKMKLKSILYTVAMAAPAMLMSSCENQDITFPDYQNGVSVYFPYQTPVRTIVLGTDEYDTTLNKAHKCIIKSTMGGAYTGKNISVATKLAPELCDNIYFDEEFASPVKVMPESYYNLSGLSLDYKGTFNGEIEVSLTDAFFADPKSVENTYVIPLMMTSVTSGSANILTGKASTEGSNPAVTNSAAWDELPMNYVLYCVKYKSKFDAAFVRCGDYTLDSNAAVQIPSEDDAKFVGHFDPVTDGIECATETKSLTSVKYAVTHEVPYTVKEDGKSVEKIQHFEADLLLSFSSESDNSDCVVTSLTDGVKVSGTGKYVKDGAKKAWGDKDRDQITLEYTIEQDGHKLKCSESLVWTHSGVVKEEFTANYK